MADKIPGSSKQSPGFCAPAWGIQEGAYAFFFGKAGVPVNGAVAISILFKLTLIFVSIPGGILLALGVGRRRNESGSDT